MVDPLVSVYETYFTDTVKIVASLHGTSSDHIAIQSHYVFTTPMRKDESEIIQIYVCYRDDISSPILQ